MTRAQLLSCIIALVFIYNAAATTVNSEAATSSSTSSSSTDETVIFTSSDHEMNVGHDTLPVPENALFFFPMSCAASYYSNSSDSECCPIASNGLKCGGDVRGSCANAFDTGYCKMSSYLATFWIDDWFQRVCVCNGNFWGVDCGMCRPGWTGTNCDEPQALRVRKNAQSLTEVEQAKLIQAFNLLHDTPHEWWPQVSQWTWLASLHTWAVSPKYNNGTEMLLKIVDYAGGPSQAAWHRSFTWLFERRCQVLLNDYEWTMPYWPMDDPVCGTSEDVIANLFGSYQTDAASYTCDVTEACDTTLRENLWVCCNCSILATSPFAHWEAFTFWGAPYATAENAGPWMLQRAFGCLPDAAVPSSEQLAKDRVLDFPTFASLLWWTHAYAHKWVGITMAAISPVSEPLFWPLHSWFDRVFEQWIRKAMDYGVLAKDNMMFEEGAIGQSQEDCMTPLVPLAKNRDFFLPSYALGYTYDIFVADDPAMTTAYDMPENATPGVIDSSSDSWVGEALSDMENKLLRTTSTSKPKKHKKKASKKHHKIRKMLKN